MIGGQVPKRHASIDVMSKVPTNVERDEKETSQKALTNRVGGDTSVNVGAKTTMFCERAQAIDDTPDGHIRKHPHDEIEKWITKCDTHRKDHCLKRQHLDEGESNTRIW